MKEITTWGHNHGLFTPSLCANPSTTDTTVTLADGLTRHVNKRATIKRGLNRAGERWVLSLGPLASSQTLPDAGGPVSEQQQQQIGPTNPS